MRQLRSTIVALLFVLAAAAPPRVVRRSRRFSASARPRTKTERALEARFDAEIRRTDIHDWVQRLASRPHHLGSPYGQANAEWMAGLFRYWGYDTTIETYEVLFPTPKVAARSRCSRRTPSAPSLAEPALAEDATSGQAAEQLPIYNAYSIDGDVTGELVYVNYGVPADYEELERRGHRRQGQDRDRALRPLLARHQAEGRGRARRDRLPDLLRPARRRLLRRRRLPEGRLPQRHGRPARLGGRHAALPRRSADARAWAPPATPSACPCKDAPTLTKIPVLPISYADARPLLEALAGPVAPEGWRGALPITYHLGPGPAKVRLQRGVRLEARPGARRDRACCAAPSSPTSG